MNISDLIELERKATPGGWITAGKSIRMSACTIMDLNGAPNGYEGGIANFLGGAYGVGRNAKENVRARDNAAFVVALRNHAVALFEVVKAAKAMRHDVARLASYLHENTVRGGALKESTKALDAALAKLEGVK